MITNKQFRLIGLVCFIIGLLNLVIANHFLFLEDASLCSTPPFWDSILSISIIMFWMIIMLVGFMVFVRGFDKHEDD